MKDIRGVRIYYLLFFISVSFVPDAFSQKLKPVVLKKLEREVYSKEEFSIIERGKDKGKRYVGYVYSKYKKEIIGTYYFGSKDGDWEYDISRNKFSEYYTKGHLDSVKGIKDGCEILVHFDEQRDTSYFKPKIIDFTSVNFILLSEEDITTTFEDNGITYETFGDTTYYYYSPKRVLIGKAFKG